MSTSIECQVRVKIFSYFTFQSNTFLDTVWCVKLGGLKYAKTFDEDDWSDNSDLSSPGPEEVDAIKIPNNYHNDKYQVAVMMYFFLKRTYSRTDFAASFEPDWDDERSYGYKKLHLKHLIKIIRADSSLAISDVLQHPYFMDANRMVEFEDRLRTYSARDRAMDSHLEIDKSEVFTGRWTTNLDRELVNLCLGNSQNFKNSKKTFVELWQSRRNRRHHRDEDSQLLRNLMGPLQVDNFAFWEKIFPAFFLHLFTRIASYKSNGIFLYASREFQGSIFFPASPEFYAACSNTTIYEN
jgi:Ribonuclease 2-5A